MSVAEVEDRAMPVFEALRRNGRPEEAHALARLMNDMMTPHTSARALEGIIARTSNRWRQDAALAANGGTEWTRMLNELERAARTTLESKRGTTTVGKNYADVMDALKQNSANYGQGTGPLAGNGKRPRVVVTGKPAKSVANARKPTTPRREKTPPREKNAWRERTSRMTKGGLRSPGGRTPSVGSRRTTLGAMSWTSRGPIQRAGTPFLPRLLLFLAGLSLLAYAAIAIADALPDLDPPETVVVNGTLRGSDARANLSPVGIDGVLLLEGQNVEYGIEEALGGGFAAIRNALVPGAPVELAVDAAAFRALAPQAGAVLDTIGNTRFRGAYDVNVQGLDASLLDAPIPVLELRSGGEVIYSRLQMTPEAEGRLANWVLLLISLLVLRFVIRRLSAE